MQDNKQIVKVSVSVFVSVSVCVCVSVSVSVSVCPADALRRWGEPERAGYQGTYSSTLVVQQPQSSSKEAVKSVKQQ